MLTHLTPRFLPQIDGLGDYSRLMAEHLRDSFAIQSRFVVGDPQWKQLEKSDDNPFMVEAVDHRSAADLELKLYETETVVVHYVPYGYHVRGVPFWINRGLRRWKHAKSGRRLIIVLHEVWASGPPWKSEFYLSFLQRRLVSGLHRLSNGVLTSTALMKGMLDKIEPGKTRLMPIPSALPPMNAQTERIFHQQGPIVVIAFGQEESRRLSIQAHEKLLCALHAEKLLQGVTVVGKGANSGENSSADIRLLRGFLPAELIQAYSNVTPERGAKLLQQADLFLSYYPSILACKSSALTAALAAGCVPVLPEAKAPEPLGEGVDILACDGSERQITRILTLIRQGRLGSIGEAGWRWYDQHASWASAASEMARLIQGR